MDGADKAEEGSNGPSGPNPVPTPSSKLSSGPSASPRTPRRSTFQLLLLSSLPSLCLGAD